MVKFENIAAPNKTLKGKSPEEVIKWVADFFGAANIALSSSLSIEDQVLTDIIAKKYPEVGIFTLDTGRLPKETYALIKETEEKYGIQIEILSPDEREVKKMVDKFGKDLFYDSLENRKKCCNIRKIKPLEKKLSQLKAWITGLRKEQSVTREEMSIVEVDNNFGLIKINPLKAWTEEETWKYIKDNDVPYNKLYDEGYKSIGCAPCSRAVAPGEDVRAGRWWWEEPDKKECGLHIKDGKVERKS